MRQNYPVKIIAVSNRVDIVDSCNERRNSLDQRWVSFLHETGGFVPLAIPNHVGTAKNILEVFPVAGILLTGGNDLVELGGNAPERDETERFLIDFAIQYKTPLLGVCRGMQMIQYYFGEKLEKIEGHVKNHHPLVLEGVSMEVNSFHNYGVKNDDGVLKVLARTSDGVIEAVRHPEYSIEGIMWHPERNTSISNLDKKIFENLFGKIEADK